MPLPSRWKSRYGSPPDEEAAEDTCCWELVSQSAKRSRRSSSGPRGPAGLPERDRFLRLSALGILHLTAGLQEHNLVVEAELRALELHAGEIGGQAEIVVLRDRFERMVVALGALHAQPHEDLGCRLRGLFRRAGDAEEVGRRLVQRIAQAGQQFAGKVRQRPIVGKRPHQVTVKAVDTPIANRRRAAAQDVGPLQRPEGRIFVAFQQFVDQLGTLAGILGIKRIRVLPRVWAARRSGRGRPGRTEKASSSATGAGDNCNSRCLAKTCSSM